jgi:pimeloyl-ACP methyl ester carboxylesterase
MYARRFNEKGSGRPVVLVHGVVVAGRYMMPTARALAHHRPVYIPDLPGFGRSGGPKRPLDTHELASSLAEWMTAAGIDRVDLVGHSFGCQTVSEFAARWPGRVGRLALLSPIGDPENRSIPDHIWRWARDCAREPLSVWGSYAGGFLRFGPRRAIGTLRHSTRDEMENRLSSIELPTLVVRGDLDTIVGHSWAEKTASLLPNGRLAVMPGAPHNVNYKTPRELTRILLPFLDEEH